MPVPAQLNLISRIPGKIQGSGISWVHCPTDARIAGEAHRLIGEIDRPGDQLVAAAIDLVLCVAVAAIGVGAERRVAVLEEDQAAKVAAGRRGQRDLGIAVDREGGVTALLRPSLDRNRNWQTNESTGWDKRDPPAAPECLRVEGVIRFKYVGRNRGSTAGGTLHAI